jgi:gamma-glutamyltranspeptidase/glutathione hydrolase
MHKEPLLGKDDISESNNESRTILIIFISLAIIIATAGVFYLLWVNDEFCCYSGAVSSSNEYATQIGIDVLKSGGNAFDAMVAMQAALTVTEPHASGIGGGFFAMIYLKKENKVISIDAREEAPVMLKERPKTPYGGISSGVPGAIKGLVKVLNTYGTWKLDQCFKPAINLANNGWILNKYSADRMIEYSDIIKLFNSSSSIYFHSNGTLRKNGEMMKNTDLGKTLELIAQDEGFSFYNGEIAQDIISSIQTSDVNPGNVSIDDFKSYIAVERNPIKFEYKGYEIYSMNMPSSAATVGLILNILKNFDLNSMGHNSAEYIRTLLNAISLGFADRNKYMADADWVDVPLEGLLNIDYAKSRSKLMKSIALSRVGPGVPPGYTGSLDNGYANNESYDTTHFSIVDKEGNIVSCTSTIEATFGNGMTVKNRGFLLNNELSDFSQDGVNKPEGGKMPRRSAIGNDKTTMGGKRPLSSMSPVIIFKDKKPIYALGSPGGNTIISHVVQVIINLIDFKMNIDDAVKSPRFTTRNEGIWYIEDPIFNNTALITDLQDMGFQDLSVVYQGLYGTGCVNVVKIEYNNQVSSAADFRRLGVADAY